MYSSNPIPLVSFILVHLACVSVAQPQWRYELCMNKGNYSVNSSYQNILDHLSSSFPFNASADGFFNFSRGTSPDMLSVIALCRGDIGPDACRSCVNDSVRMLPQVCPLRKEAMGGYDECMLRYSNRSILGVEDSSTYAALFNPNDITTDRDQYDTAVGSLMYALESQATSGDQLRKFATGMSNVTVFQRIYGLVQCTLDLSEDSCKQCLERAIENIPSCCGGKKGGRVVMPSCNIRFEPAQFYQSATTDATAPPPVAPSTNTTTPTSGRGINNAQTIIIIIACTVSVILVILIFIFCLRRCRKPWKKLEDESVAVSVESLHFDFGTIRVATDNFFEANKLGQGGFGAVYKGKLSNGEEIAVKRLSMDSGQGELEFKNEVMLVAKLQHRNLVKLLGFSLHGKERLLVYEFVPNTSLERFIFGDTAKRSRLDWETCQKVIGGIARGLLYLHEDSCLRIVHRDLKASNILLDAKMNPKIADFGMARLFSFDQTQDNTTRVVGTFGYMAPEYAFHGLFSVKSDVFSFGVLVLEIISGRKIFSFRDPENGDDLLAFAWKNWRVGTGLKLMHPTLVGGPKRRDITRCIHIGLLCVQENVDDRPAMASVVMMLSSNSLTLPAPSRPAFYMETTVRVATPDDSYDSSDP